MSIIYYIVVEFFFLQNLYLFSGRYRNVTTATPYRMLTRTKGCLQLVGVLISIWLGHVGSQGKRVVYSKN